MTSRTGIFHRVLVAGVLAGIYLLPWSGARAEEPCEPCSAQRLDTAVHWAESPDRAVQLAQQQDKLVFVIQVSGNFARSEFT